MMKMKSIMCAVACAAFTLVSCDQIDENDRYLYYDAGVPSAPDDEGDGVTRPTSVQRGVLIEDFTGQRCVNCPNAVPVINRLEASYGSKIVPVAVHSGLVYPAETFGDWALQTPEGEQYYKDAGNPAQPSARIGRTGSIFLVDMWTIQAQNILRQQSPVWLNVTNAYDETTRKVSINVEAYGIDAAAGNIQLWLIEDGIVAPQMMPDGSTEIGYVHNHVFRAAVNGTYGVPFAISKGEDKTVTAEAVLSDKWVAENMSVVAFIYNGDGVVHVVKKAVMGGDDDESDDDAIAGDAATEE